MKSIIEFFKKLFAPKPQPELVPPQAPKVQPVVDPIPWFTLLETYLGTKEVLPDGSVNPIITYFFTFTSYRTKLNKAWCAATQCCMLRKTGYKDPNSAAAMGFIKYGTPCEYKKGALIVMEHPDGGHHVTQFSHWIDEKKKLAMCLGGNQSNMVKFSQYNFNVEKVLRVCWPEKA